MRCTYCQGALSALGIDVSEIDPCDITIIAECQECGAVVVDSAYQGLSWTAPYQVVTIYEAA